MKSVMTLLFLLIYVYADGDKIPDACETSEATMAERDPYCWWCTFR